ncbi:hypothetical protein [Flavobacterium poyangense]|uniref:hypothetical protein n=1 Tax=Flavobacterium poyangense TaxID=2204302 RepID=UPI0014229A97|nr:hypothetical protein [Flavobacterium sp. JXAS1]
MAIQTLNIIKSWFKTGLKPTQTQFWDTWDSFRHKSEKVPVGDVEGLYPLLDYKADKAVLDDHLLNADAHPNLLTKARIIPEGQFLILKAVGNTNENDAEVNDVVKGIVQNCVIEGIYLGGEMTSLRNFEIITKQEL